MHKSAKEQALTVQLPNLSRAKRNYITMALLLGLAVPVLVLGGEWLVNALFSGSVDTSSWAAVIDMILRFAMTGVYAVFFCAYLSKLGIGWSLLLFVPHVVYRLVYLLLVNQTVLSETTAQNMYADYNRIQLVAILAKELILPLVFWALVVLINLIPFVLKKKYFTICITYIVLRSVPSTWMDALSAQEAGKSISSPILMGIITALVYFLICFGVERMMSRLMQESESKEHSKIKEAQTKGDREAEKPVKATVTIDQTAGQTEAEAAEDHHDNATADQTPESTGESKAK